MSITRKFSSGSAFASASCIMQVNDLICPGISKLLLNGQKGFFAAITGDGKNACAHEPKETICLLNILQVVSGDLINRLPEYVRFQRE